MQSARRKLDQLASVLLEPDEPVRVEIVGVVAPHRWVEMCIDHVGPYRGAFRDEDAGECEVFQRNPMANGYMT